MDEKVKTGEITFLSDSVLKETLTREEETLASFTKMQLEAYRETRSRYELTNGNVSLFYFGARHAFDPGNPQFQKIEESLNYFIAGKDKTTFVVLVEGFVPMITDDIDHDIRGTGERGFTTHIAGNLGVRIDCIEPDRKEEVRYLLGQFHPAEIEYYYFLRAVRDFFIKGNVHGNKTFEQYSAEMLAGHKKMFGDLDEFSGFDFSLENIKNIHQSITGEAFDEHNMLSVNPRSDRTVINAVACQCSSFRDFSHVRNIEKYLWEGYSVFIVNGADHAVIQKPALEVMFGE